MGQEPRLPRAQLHNTFLGPESQPRAPARPGPGERRQEADWKSRLAASCAHGRRTKCPPPAGSLTQRLGNELREEGHEGRRAGGRAAAAPLLGLGSNPVYSPEPQQLLLLLHC